MPSTKWTDIRTGRTADEGGSPAVRRLAALITAAIDAGASDLHLEPDRDGLRVRVRVDGHLRDLDPPPAALVPAVLTRIRLLARVDLAERRLPQDGRFTWQAAKERIDIRAAFLPVARGEKIALRLLRHPGAAPALDTLGMNDVELARVSQALARPNGLVLVVGPTGSGKSTTLHAALVHLRSSSRSLASVEDPVEFDIPGVSQVAVDEEVGRTFAVVLRALLRQDPDVLMVGEIRDDDSARIACRAALTGHLVLSSLHASHAREALVRLPEIGVADYLVRATVALVVAQRLVRRLCAECAGASPATEDAALWFARAGLRAPRALPAALGCATCHGSGYRGRVALFETASTIDDAPAPFAAGSLGAAGLAHVIDGSTTLEEVLTHCPHPIEGGVAGDSGDLR
ncbi:MAG TPA: GspE/PulE family protein [Candidatus Limnocylindrales bacterium]|nr:GspE/PulE family protein [Candidatus Limnocylindrales bacterium]